MTFIYIIIYIVIIYIYLTCHFSKIFLELRRPTSLVISFRISGSFASPNQAETWGVFPDFPMGSWCKLRCSTGSSAVSQNFYGMFIRNLISADRCQNHDFTEIFIGSWSGVSSRVCSVVYRLSLLTLVYFSKEQKTHLLGVLGLGNSENNDP